jgi:hypothetical protein
MLIHISIQIAERQRDETKRLHVQTLQSYELTSPANWENSRNSATGIRWLEALPLDYAFSIIVYICSYISHAADIISYLRHSKPLFLISRIPFHHIHTISGTYPASYPTNIGCSFPASQGTRSVKLTIHLHLAPTLVFLQGVLLEPIDKFIFTIVLLT